MMAGGCGGDDKAAAPEATPAQAVTTATPATEPFPDPTSDSEVALAALEIARTPKGRRPPIPVVGLMLDEMQEFGACANTREELAEYTLGAVDSFGAEVRPSEVLAEVSAATAAGGDGGDCEAFFAAYVDERR